MKLAKSMAALSVTAALSACAMAGGSTDYKPDRPAPTESEYLPFYIAIKTDGTPVVVGRDGKEYEGKPVSFPLNASRIDVFKTFAYVKYKGSCEIVMDLDGQKISFSLPDSYCKSR